jgi:hypothetical protein
MNNTRPHLEKLTDIVKQLRELKREATVDLRECHDVRIVQHKIRSTIECMLDGSSVYAMFRECEGCNDVISEWEEVEHLAGNFCKYCAEQEREALEEREAS